MLFNGYLRKGIVYVPTVAQLQTGAYMDVEPVAVVPVANAEGLRRAFVDAIGRGNAIVPNPPKDKWPPPVLLKYAQAKTWSAFARDTSIWSIKESGGNFRIAGYLQKSKGYWEPDPDNQTVLPPGSTVDDVIARMIAILQRAANSNPSP